MRLPAPIRSGVAVGREILSLLFTPRGFGLIAFSFAVAFLMIDLVYSGYQLAASRNGIQPNSIPIGSDFIALWSAGRLAHQGTPALAYNPDILWRVHDLAILGVVKGWGYWFYPPPAQVLMQPLGALPYFVALPLYLAFTLGLYTFVMWRLRPKADTLLFLFAFQGTWLCLLSGQNGFFSAALMGGALLLFPKAPGAAGVLWGLFAYKPQLAVQVPFALLTQGARGKRAILSAAATGGAFIALSLLLLGPETWRAFLDTAARPLALLNSGALPLSHKISTYSTLHLAGLSHGVSLAGQGVTALLAFLSLHVLWRSSASLNLKGAGLMWGSMLTTPHLFHYELPLMGLGLLLLWKEAELTGWRRGEPIVLFLAWLSPPFLPFPAFPLLFLLLMLHTLRRTRGNSLQADVDSSSPLGSASAPAAFSR